MSNRILVFYGSYRSARPPLWRQKRTPKPCIGMFATDRKQKSIRWQFCLRQPQASRPG
jgi:hypothetical protein